MMNRRQIDESTIEFEDFAGSSQPFVGEEYELPMSAFGTTVARFAVTIVRTEGCRVVAQARKVSA